MKTKYYLKLAASLLIISSCGSGEDQQHKLSPEIVNNPATAGETSGEIKRPAFTFEESNFDFGTINSGEKVTHVYRFKNTGNADLVISQAKGSCGCTQPTYTPDPIAPGDEGEISVTFNSEGIAGQVVKDITVLANTTPTTKVLTMSGEVIKVNK